VRPDLVVEILSPPTRGHDVPTKRALYARAEVRERWIVDPIARTVAVLVLDGDALRERQTAAGSQPVSSRVLPTASFPAEAVFAGFDDLDPEP
jgi:Uma2 family endonuclease